MPAALQFLRKRRARYNMKWTTKEFTKSMSEFLWIENVHGSIFRQGDELRREMN